MKTIYIGLLIAFSLTLTGCKKVFMVYVSQAPDGIVSLRFEPSEGATNKGAEITKLQVYKEILPSKTLEKVWSIHSKSGAPEKVYNITYGVLPSGFNEVKPAQPLIFGELYDVMSSGVDITGSTDFKYGK